MFLSSRHTAAGSFDKAVKWWGPSNIKSSYVSTGKPERGQRNKEAIKTDRRNAMAEKGQRERQRDR